MPLARRRQPRLPEADPCWINDHNLVIGLPDHMQSVVTHADEKTRGMPGMLPGDRQIMTFLGHTLNYRRRGEPLLDTSAEGVRRTGVTRDHTQLWLRVHPSTGPLQVWLPIYECWEKATGRTLDLADGNPPTSEGIPGE